MDNEEANTTSIQTGVANRGRATDTETYSYQLYLSVAAVFKITTLETSPKC